MTDRIPEPVPPEPAPHEAGPDQSRPDQSGSSQPGFSGPEPAQPRPPEEPAPPGQPTNALGNIILTALSGQYLAGLRTIQGQPIEAIRLAQRIPWFWIITFGIGSLVSAFFYSTAAARAAGLARSAFDSPFGTPSVPYLDFSFVDWLLLFIMTLVVTAVVFLLRALALKLVFSTRGQSETFATSANIIAVAYIPLTALFTATGALLLMLMGTFQLTLILITALTLTVASLLAELLIYIGLNRTAQFAKSPLIPHVLLTGAWIIAVSVILRILGELAISSAI